MRATPKEYGAVSIAPILYPEEGSGGHFLPENELNVTSVLYVAMKEQGRTFTACNEYADSGSNMLQ